MRRHFSHEEALMREVKYPGYESHRHEHVTLLAEYTDLLRGVRRHGMGYLDLRVMAALKACIIGHIAVTDRKLGEHYHKRPWQAGTLPAQSLPAYR